MKKICLDAGVLDLYLSETRTKQVKMLFDDVKNRTAHAHVVNPVLSEVFFHQCTTRGAKEAAIQLRNVLDNYPIELVELDVDLLFSAGKLRCQHASTLSYIDCMSIAYCLHSGAEFHTTEKTIKQIPHNTLARLRVVRYAW
ncbi:MAG: PIN domain-containing protein [Candidatus Lokiarchaeota archaeon]|nr:PIN domain-containing protein [Candidatus Lokiarchaeota archaeon]